VVAHDLSTGKEVAYDVRTHAPPPGHHAHHARAAQEERLPGLYVGTVVSSPRVPPSVRLDDGVLMFADLRGAAQQALFGAGRVRAGAPPLRPGLVVEFGLVRNVGTGGFLAVDVRPAPAAADGPAAALAAAAAADADAPLPDGLTGRQLGRVALLKKEFGFIRQVARPGDLFFHFSQLEGLAAGELAAGLDVEFLVRRDREGKLSAGAVRRAPPGAVAFDTVGQEVLRGWVVERPAAGKQHVQSGGVIEYELPPTAAAAAGRTARLSFAAADAGAAGSSLRPGDHVTFRVATNVAAAAAAAEGAAAPAAAAAAGRRAIEVAGVRAAGVVDVANPQRNFGFITYREPPLPTALPLPAEAAAAPEEEAPADATAERGSDGAPATDGAALAAADPAAPAAAPAAPAAPGTERRVFFHFTAVAGGVVLGVGDEVSFSLSFGVQKKGSGEGKKAGELYATRVKRTKAAPQPPPEAAPREAAEAAPPAARPDLLLRNPNKPRLTGNLQSGEHKTQRMPKVRGRSGAALGRG
jgi:cold shock CspA family protein